MRFAATTTTIIINSSSTPSIHLHHPLIIFIYATLRAAFYPARATLADYCTVIILNVCQFCTTSDHRFNEWMRFNYHYSSNYKFTELDSCNMQLQCRLSSRWKPSSPVALDWTTT